VAAPETPPPRLTLIGAGHVFDIQGTMRSAMAALRPDVVFLELDRGRLESLLHRERGGKLPEGGGLVHRRMARFQDSVARMHGAQVGSEMLGALEGARLAGARVLLVDDGAEQAIRRAVREATWRERLRFGGMLVGGAIRSLRPRRDPKAEIEAELARYQSDPDGVLGELAQRFPTVHRILIEERDRVMAQRIRKGLAGARHGVAVLGDGHVPGMLPLLADLRPTVYRLADVRSGRLPQGLVASGTTERVGFTVQWRGT
jgi:pheromone shutdown protein TraB